MDTDRDGRLLTGPLLRHALQKERAFLNATWKSENLRFTGYDLRLAADKVIFTGIDGRAQTYPPGSPFPGDIILQPGDNAFLSTEERVCLGWDIAGNIGPKFSLAARGMLVLTGLIVDPGYGWVRNEESGEWQRDPETRLHFVVANVGPEPICLRKGDTIAAIQFYDVAAIPLRDRSETLSIGLSAYAEYFEKGSDRALPGLAFFRNIRDVQLRSQEALDKARDLYDKTETMLHRVEKVEGGSNFVVTFGVYLVSVTLLGVVVTLLVTAISNLPSKPPLRSLVAIGIAGVMLAGFTVWALFVALRSLQRTAPDKPS